MRAGRYGAVLSTPGSARLIGFGFLARLPDGMLNLAILLAVSRSVSLAVGGLAAGIYSAANAVGSPLRGRWVDRRGAIGVTLASGLGQAVLLIALAAVVHAGDRAGVLVVAALAGLCAPPLVAVIRGVWVRRLPHASARAAASALESVIGETVYLAGTVVAGTVGGAAPAVAGLLVAAVLRAVGCCGLAASPLTRGWQGQVDDRGRRGPRALSSRTVRAVLVTNVLVFSAFGSVDVAVTHFTGERHETAYVGLLLAGYALGSVAGGLVQGARDWGWRLERQQVVLLGLAAALLVPAGFASSVPALVGCLVLAGLPVAPSATAGFGLVARDAVPGTDAEAYTWMTAASFVGLAVGTSLGGDVGRPFLLAVGFAAAAAMSTLALIGRTAEPSTVASP